MLYPPLNKNNLFVFIMKDNIKSDLDKECQKLLEGITSQKDTVLKITQSFGISYPHLIPFVMGIVYAQLQTYFKDLYVLHGIAQEPYTAY